MTTGIISLALAGTLSAQEIARTFLKGPYLQAPGADTMTIMWESPTNRPGFVRYGLNGVLNRELRLEMPRRLVGISSNAISRTNIFRGRTNVTYRSTTNIVFLYEMTLTNLRPNSVYTYSAETDDVSTPPKKFKTFGAHPNTVRFTAYGDTRTNPKTHAAVAANFKRYSPDFILHTGDLVTNGRRYDQWGREFFGPLTDVIDEIPILPAIGNHEEDGLHYLHFLHLPGKERWYSYDVGPVHMLSLDYRYEKETEDQFKFARQDLLTSKAPWKVVFLHYPVFNIGGHVTGWGHAAYLPLFHEAKVDLVVAGHSHIYERFRPIAAQSGAGTWPITHITTGGGGAPLTITHPHPALAAFAATNHFVLFEATPTSLTGLALTTNNVVLDEFTLTKRNGRPLPPYFAQVYPEEVLRLSFDAAPSLVAGATAAPTNKSTARLMFTIRPMKTTKEPVDLEISLTPASAVSYELADGPIRVTAPAATESNKVVWADLRATGKKKIEPVRRGQDLSPALILQARVMSGSVETLAYGQRCKVTTNAVEAAKRLMQTEPARSQEK